MEGYEYPDYGMEDGNPYSSPEYSATSQNNTGTKTEDAPETPVLAVLTVTDAGRLNEIDTARYDVSSQSSSDTSHRISGEKQPVVAYRADSRRDSVHPLGIIEKPAGVSPVDWERLDKDKLLLKKTRTEATAVTGVSPVDGESRTVPNAGTSLVHKDNAEESVDGEHDTTEMPFLDHLEEFRWSLLKSLFSIAFGMIASWFLSDMFYKTITRLAEEAEIPLISTKLMEPIMMRLQMALVMGLFISLPFVFYFMWSFISPGLYKKEKKWILPLVFVATLFFFIGASIAYFIIIPFMLVFIKNFMPDGIEQWVTISDFVAKLLKFTMLFGVIFEMPLLSYILAKIGVLKYSWMTRYRKYAIVCIFIAGAILTPPDPLSQIMMAAPLIILYEISILVARYAGRKTLL